MTYREFIASRLPPAPETSDLKRLRIVTGSLCFGSALLVWISSLLGNRPLPFAAFSHLVALFGIGLLAMFVVRKVRHDLGYWTDERVAIHRFVETVEHPDRPLVK